MLRHRTGLSATIPALLTVAALVVSSVACGPVPAAGPARLQAVADVSATSPPRIVGACLVGNYNFVSGPWSPSGPLLAVDTVDDSGSDRHLAVLEVDAATGTLETRWTCPHKRHCDETPPAWSPDGHSLAVVQEVGPCRSGAWPEGFAAVFLDALTGATDSRVRLNPPEAEPVFHIIGTALWPARDRLLVSSHLGTAIDCLWLLTIEDQQFRPLTWMTYRFKAEGPLAAFEKWRRGGTRTGVVDAAGVVRWCGWGTVQIMNDLRDGRLLLTAWPSSTPGRAALPSLAVWDAAGDWGQTVRRLRPATGWGAWNDDGSLMAALEIGPGEGSSPAAEDDVGPAVDLVVLDPAGTDVSLRLSLGRAPGDEDAQYWYWKRQWFETRQPRWSPTGDRLTFIDDQGDLWLLDIDGQRKARLLTAAAPTAGYGPPPVVRTYWSPDGRFLAVFHPVRRPDVVGEQVMLTVIEVPVLDR